MNVRRTHNPWFIAAAVVLVVALALAWFGEDLHGVEPLEFGVLGGGALYAIGSS